MTNVQSLIDRFDANAAYERYLAARADRLAAVQQLRPSVMFEPSINQFRCPATGRDCYSADYAGIFGVGFSPDEAYRDFDQSWLGVN